LASPFQPVSYRHGNSEEQRQQIGCQPDTSFTINTLEVRRSPIEQVVATVNAVALHIFDRRGSQSAQPDLLSAALPCGARARATSLSRRRSHGCRVA